MGRRAEGVGNMVEWDIGDGEGGISSRGGSGK